MKKLLTPTALLFYLLVLLVFFFAGTYFSAIFGVVKGQGLAGPAIVLGYGVITAALALLASFFLVAFLRKKILVRLNKGLGVILFIFTIITGYRIITKEQSNRSAIPSPQRTTLSTASSDVKNTEKSTFGAGSSEMGLGVFTPNTANTSVLYFYGNPRFHNPDSKQPPTDSLVFRIRNHRGTDISYAPPWFVPRHLKLDYGILYFTVKSVNRNFIEIVVNEPNQKTAYVERHSGKFTYWPDFLLKVHSIEFLPGQEQVARHKPLSYAGAVDLDFDFMQPLQIRGNWMRVELHNRDFQKIGEGWIEWRNEKGWCVRYSLLS